MDIDVKKDSYFMNIGVDIHEFLMMKYLHYTAYMDYNRYINVPASAKENEIWDLVAWGIKNKEPMGNYVFLFSYKIGRILLQYNWKKDA